MQYSEIEQVINKDDFAYACLNDYLNKKCSYYDHTCKGGPLTFYFIKLKNLKLVRIRNFCASHYERETVYGMRVIKKLNEKDIFTIKILLENGPTN